MSCQIPRISRPSRFTNVHSPSTLSSWNVPSNLYPFDKTSFPWPSFLSCLNWPKYMIFHTLVSDPVLFDFQEISIIKTILEFIWLFIIKSSMTMEKIILKITLVSNFTWLVEQLSSSAHKIIFPLTFIHTSIFIYIFTPSLTFSFNLVSFVFTTIFELINSVNRLRLIKFNYWLLRLSLKCQVFLFWGIYRNWRVVGVWVSFAIWIRMRRYGIRSWRVVENTCCFGHLDMRRR